MFGLSSTEKYNKILKKKFVKKIKLPSGAKFKIKKLTPLEMMSETLPLMNNVDLSNNSEEKNKQIWDELSDEEKNNYIDYNNRIIIIATISPKLVVGKVKGCIDIWDLYTNRDDYLCLLNEVTVFSIGHKNTSELAKKKVT